jgi:aminopeptidase C
MEFYRIVGICLGVPPTEFSWEYYDKSKEYHKVGPISPLDFYNEHVKKLFDVDEKVSRFYNYVTKFYFFLICNMYLLNWLGNERP